MKSVIKTVMTVVFLFMFAGCSTDLFVKKDKELEALVQAFIKHNVEMEKKRAQRRGEGINKLTVEDGLVTADLENASVPEVVRRVFDKSGLSYMLDQVRLQGRITARFENLPLLKSLNLILEPLLLSADQKADMVVITSGIIKEETQEPDAEVYLEFALNNLDLETAITLLRGLYPASDMSPEDSEIKFGPVSASNTIYLRGPRNSVSRASQILMKADSNVRHVAIEVLVVEFNSGALEELGSSLSELQIGKYKDIHINGGIINFTKPVDAVSNSTSFRAAVNFLVSNNKARLISRPYISTMSGKRAKIEITSERYVITDKEAGTTDTEPVPSGVILQITPTVLDNGKLQMKVDVEDSQFSTATVDNVTIEKSKNSAHTMMQVEDGQTIIIGGLVLNQKAWSNAGFPFLRHIPILNLLFADRQDKVEEKEVAIYVTPHIWEPNMISPLIEPDALTIKEGPEEWIRKVK